MADDEKDTYIHCKKYRCPHGRQCKSRCSECLGRPVNQGKCSRCKKDYNGDIYETFKGKPLQTCVDCRYKSSCNHGERLKKKCKICKNEVKAKWRRENRCEHNKRKDMCFICNFEEFLKRKIRSYVSRAVKQKRTYKSTIDYLDCSIAEFKQHIERQFKEGMSWDNYGTEWHIDHIVPIKYGDPTIEEVFERLHWTNTQPLWASENMSKGNRFIG
jgi:hypothetical protein